MLSLTAVRILCLVTGALFGSIPTGYLVARLYGVDIRKVGSGNVGSTNVSRNLGTKAGILTFTGDVVKSFIAMLITAALFGEDPDTRYLVTMYTGTGAVIGHDFSPWLKFKGGKGIATTGGVMLFTDWRFFVSLTAVVLSVAGITGYISAGSLSVAFVYLILQLYILYKRPSFGWSFYPQTFSPGYTAEILVLVLINVFLCLFRHKGNIQRLIKGEERKFYIKKNKNGDKHEA